MNSTRLSSDVVITHSSNFSGFSTIRSNKGEVEFSMRDMAVFIIDKILDEETSSEFLTTIMTRLNIKSIEVKKVSNDTMLVSNTRTTKIELK